MVDALKRDKKHLRDEIGRKDEQLALSSSNTAQLEEKLERAWSMEEVVVKLESIAGRLERNCKSRAHAQLYALVTTPRCRNWRPVEPAFALARGL